MKKSKPVRFQKQIPFSKLGAAEKRVAIARDVIGQINADVYKMKTGTWAEIEVVWDKGSDPTQFGQCELLNGLKPIERKIQCTCCGIGAAFLSSIRLANKAVMGTQLTGGFAQASKQLIHFFSREQMELIESAFEMGNGARHSDDGDAKLFGEKYSADEKRAIAIFKNIIDNNGTFIP